MFIDFVFNVGSLGRLAVQALPPLRKMAAAPNGNNKLLYFVSKHENVNGFSLKIFREIRKHLLLKFPHFLWLSAESRISSGCPSLCTNSCNNVYFLTNQEPQQIKTNLKKEMVPTYSFWKNPIKVSRCETSQLETFFVGIIWKKYLHLRYLLWFSGTQFVKM